jgi:hypothetical protein
MSSVVAVIEAVLAHNTRGVRLAIAAVVRQVTDPEYQSTHFAVVVRSELLFELDQGDLHVPRPHASEKDASEPLFECRHRDLLHHLVGQLHEAGVDACCVAAIFVRCESLTKGNEFRFNVQPLRLELR